MNQKFNDRMLTQTVSEEWVTHQLDVDMDEAKYRFENAAHRFEQSYNAVADVTMKQSHAVRLDIVLTAIPARDADPNVIGDGMNEMLYWVLNDE